MYSLIDEDLQRQIANEHVRLAGDHSRVERRRRERHGRVRTVVGRGLVSAGELILRTESAAHRRTHAA